jgi:hypothetical protein
MNLSTETNNLISDFTNGLINNNDLKQKMKSSHLEYRDKIANMSFFSVKKSELET